MKIYTKEEKRAKKFIEKTYITQFQIFELLAMFAEEEKQLDVTNVGKNMDKSLLEILEPHKGETIDVDFMIELINSIAKESKD